MDTKTMENKNKSEIINLVKKEMSKYNRNNDEELNFANDLRPEEISYFIKNKYIEVFKVYKCRDCGNDLMVISNAEYNAYKHYFQLKEKEEKNLDTIITMHSIEQLIDFNICCDNCNYKDKLTSIEYIDKTFNGKFYKASAKFKSFISKII